MAKLKLFGAFPSPFVYRVELALKIKRVEYEYIEEDLKNKSSLLLQYNPVYKKVPVLVHAGKSIVESSVIMEYIEETWKQNPLLPEDPYERAVARFWVKFGEEKCGPSIIKFFHSIGKEQEKAMKEVIENLNTLEEQGLKENKRFFGGERIGLPDLVLGFIAERMEVLEEVIGTKVMNADTFPRLHAWRKNFLDDSIIKENLPSRDRMFAYYKAGRENFLSSISAK